jgi:hypothetical protein
MTVEVDADVVGVVELVMSDGGEVVPPERAKLAEAAFRGLKLAGS